MAGILLLLVQQAVDAVRLLLDDLVAETLPEGTTAVLPLAQIEEGAVARGGGLQHGHVERRDLVGHQLGLQVVGHLAAVLVVEVHVDAFGVLVALLRNARHLRVLGEDFAQVQQDRRLEVSMGVDARQAEGTLVARDGSFHLFEALKNKSF